MQKKFWKNSPKNEFDIGCDMMQDRDRKIKRILLLVLFFNLLVALMKAILGFLSNSISLTADALHSVLDSASNIIGLIGITLSSKPVDKSHPYGHEKFEPLASLFIGVFIFLTFFGILNAVIIRLFNNITPSVDAITLFFVFLTIIVNSIISVYERKMGISLKSDILLADSSHTRSDILATSLVLISLILVHFGLYILDPIIALLLAFLIIKIGFQTIRENAMVLTDATPIDIIELKKVILEVPEVLECHKLRARGSINAFYVDCHILVDPNLSIVESHNISSLVEQHLKQKYSGLKDVIIHIEPYIDSEKLET